MELEDARQLLRPYASEYERLLMPLHGMSRDDLIALSEACGMMNWTNCGWSTFHVAQIVVKEARSQIGLRVPKPEAVS